MMLKLSEILTADSKRSKNADEDFQNVSPGYRWTEGKQRTLKPYRQMTQFP